jgi:hypothetical protein
MARALTTAGHTRKALETPERVRSVRNAPETTTMAAAAAVSVDKPLTEKQRAFATARAKGESIPNAMALAGYNEQPSYGYRLDKMPNVQALIRQEAELYAEASQMTRKKVIDMQLEAFEMARMMAEPATMVAAAREIGKICGLYEPQKIQIDARVTHEMGRFNQLSDADLLKIIAEGENPAAMPALPAPTSSTPEGDSPETSDDLE